MTQIPFDERKCLDSELRFFDFLGVINSISKNGKQTWTLTFPSHVLTFRLPKILIHFIYSPLSIIPGPEPHILLFRRDKEPKVPPPSIMEATSQKNLKTAVGGMVG